MRQAFKRLWCVLTHPRHWQRDDFGTHLCMRCGEIHNAEIRAFAGFGEVDPEAIREYLRLTNRHRLQRHR